MGWQPKIELVNDERHQFFLREAYRVAQRLSDDPITKVGAVLVRNSPVRYQVVIYGANHVERAVEGTREELADKLRDRKWKYEHTTHAEVAAIDWARKLGIAMEGTTIYMPWVPCRECAEEIIKTGIAALVGHKQMIMKTPERWWESTDKALGLLEEKGVERYMFDGEIRGVSSLFNGEVWWP